MKKKISGLKRRSLVVLFSCMLVALLLLGSCSAYDRKVDKFWSSVRPLSTLSESHYKLGRYYQKQGRYEQAIEEFSKALNVDRELCKAYNGIAMSYDALKECDLAHKAYELALRCDPDKAYIYNNYGYSSILCNQLEKGTALLLKAEELSTGSEQIKNNLELAQLAVTRQPAPDSDIIPPPNSGLDLATATPRELATYMALAAGQKLNQEKAIEANDEVEAAAEQDTPEVEEQPSVVLVPSVGTNFQPHLLLDNFKAPDADEVILPAETSVAAVNNKRVLMPVLKPAKKRPVALTEQAVVTTETEIEKTVAKPASEEKPAIILPPLEEPLQPAKPPEVQAKTPKEVEVDEKSQALHQKSETGVEVSNGNGVTGMARRSSKLLGNYGFKVRRITNANNFHFDDSVIYYREGFFGVAQELSHFIPGDQKLEEVDSLGRAAIGVRVLLGNDLVMLDFPEHFTQLSYIQLEEGKPGVWKDLVKLTMDE